MNEWIDARKQPPTNDGTYLVYWGSVFIARYTKSSNKWRRDDSNSGLEQEVSHWMPLPEAPMKNT